MLRQVRAAVGGLRILTLEGFEEDFQLYLLSILRAYRAVNMRVPVRNVNVLITRSLHPTVHTWVGEP